MATQNAAFFLFCFCFCLLTIVQNAACSSKHFVLVHGAGYGAWCWYKVKTLLEERGYNATALDLAGQGRNLTPLGELQTIDDYQKPLYSYMANLSSNDKIILVGHSIGGLAVSSAMERFPSKISFAVFLTAYMVGPNLTAEQVMEKIFSVAGLDFFIDSQVTVNSNGNLDVITGPKFQAQRMYNRSPREDYTLARSLIREVRLFNDSVSKAELLVSKEKYGTVPRAYFIATEDNTILLDAQRWMVENNPPNKVREIKGADHMVMASKPEELVSNLLEVAMHH